MKGTIKFRLRPFMFKVLTPIVEAGVQGLRVERASFALNDLVKKGYVKTVANDINVYVATDIGKSVWRADSAAWARHQQQIVKRDVALQQYRNKR